MTAENAAPQLRERMEGGFWQEWYCDVPPKGLLYKVYPGRDEWSDDPATGEPLRKILAITVTEDRPSYQDLGTRHRHSVPAPVREHDHLGGGVPHTHDPETDLQVTL